MRIVLVVLALGAMVLTVACPDDKDEGPTCQSGCEAAIAADCDNGPASQTACETDCEALLAGTCGTQYQALMNCADGETVTCDASGIPTIAGCSTQQATFVDCLTP